MQKLGVFGGTFDPIHNGHLVAAKEVLERLQLDQVLFVPTGDSYQKTNVSSARDRVAMLNLAIAGNQNFAVDLVDVDRTGPTYTVDTLIALKAKHPEARLYFILGTDAMSSIQTWKDANLLPALAKFVVVTRPGFEIELPEWPEGSVDVVAIPALDISATQIRQRIELGEDVSKSVPEAVAGYISSNRLYQRMP